MFLTVIMQIDGKHDIKTVLSLHLKFSILLFLTGRTGVRRAMLVKLAVIQRLSRRFREMTS